VSDAKFRSDIPVREVPDGCCGSDALIARAAWVQEPGVKRDGEGEDAYRRVITAMLKGRHGTPFEKGMMTVYIDAPAVVWWEWTRHRFMSLDVEDFSFSLESGRYKVLDGEFYAPPSYRPCKEPAGFKPMRPVLEDDKVVAAMFEQQVKNGAFAAWERYGAALEFGAARELSRLRLPFSVYYAGYVSANPRTWLQFFSLRTKSDNATYPTFPQWEIQEVSEQCEALFKHRWPLTYAAFVQTGRVAP
jgi:thymidylate synthase (FAD)